jgi:hypothetical protein
MGWSVKGYRPNQPRPLRVPGKPGITLFRIGDSGTSRTPLGVTPRRHRRPACGARAGRDPRPAPAPRTRQWASLRPSYASGRGALPHSKAPLPQHIIAAGWGFRGAAIEREP